MPIWCQADANASLSGANPVAIYPDPMSIQVVNPVPIRCTSSVHLFESHVNLVLIQCQSDANLETIHGRSKLNQVSIHRQSVPYAMSIRPICFQSSADLSSVQYQPKSAKQYCMKASGLNVFYHFTNILTTQSTML